MIKYIFYKLFYWIHIIYKKRFTKNFHIIKFNLFKDEIDYNDWMLYSCFTIFCQFSETEMYKINWNKMERKNIRSSFDDLYRWWTIERPRDYKLIEKNISNLKCRVNKELFELSKVADNLSALKEIDREMFIKLTDYFDYFVKFK